MDSWLKKSIDYKPTADNLEAMVKADATLTCRSKKRKFNEKNEASHIKKRTGNENVFAVWFYFNIIKQ